MSRMQPPKYPRFNATLQASPSIRPDAGPSVSDATRMAKEALANAEVQAILMGQGGRVPVTGNYYDAIRAMQQVRTSAPTALTNQFVRGIFNTRGGVKSFAAANYSYPSQQMVIGAALAGVSASPSEDRKRQMAQLLGLGNVGRGVEACGVFDDCTVMTGDFALTVPALEIETRLADFAKLDLKNNSLFNISWMSGAKGCRTEVDNRTGKNVLGLKPGKSTYASNEGIQKVKAAAVVQAMYDAKRPLNMADLLFYGQLKAHDVGELRGIIQKYAPGTALPSELTGDGSGERSSYCNWASKIPSQAEVCATAAKYNKTLPGCPALPGAGGAGGAGGSTPGGSTGTDTGSTTCQQLNAYPAGTEANYKQYGVTPQSPSYGCWYGYDGKNTVVWGTNPATLYAPGGGGGGGGNPPYVPPAAPASSFPTAAVIGGIAVVGLALVMMRRK